MKTLRVLSLLLLALPAMVQAQFNFTTNNGAITIKQYTGPGGDVSIPSTTNGYPVTSIGIRSFSGSGLTSVTIPDSVTSIESSAFNFCSGLTSVTIPNGVTNIGSFAFASCSKLTSVTIPNSVTSIGQGAFGYCTNLTSVAIPKGVTNIGSYAFEGCFKLTSVTIPNGITSIGSYALSSCSNLLAAYFQGNAPPDDGTAFWSARSATVYYLPGTTGWGVTFGGRPTKLWNPQAQTSGASFGVQTNQFGFNITGSSNLVIVVEAATDLANPAWIPVGTNTLNTYVGTNGTSYFSDPQWTNYPGRFYRFRSP